MYSSSNIITIIKSEKMRWAEMTALLAEEENTYKVSVKKKHS
jgi:1,2-phenylacetyl-CoA epoxidase PaaB subunit